MYYFNCRQYSLKYKFIYIKAPQKKKKKRSRLEYPASHFNQLSVQVTISIIHNKGTLHAYISHIVLQYCISKNKINLKKYKWTHGWLVSSWTLTPHPPPQETNHRWIPNWPETLTNNTFHLTVECQNLTHWLCTHHNTFQTVCLSYTTYQCFKHPC